MRTLLIVTACLAACGGRPPPTKEEIDDAKGRVRAALAAAEQARRILELLGILPVYECGESERVAFVGKVADGFRRDYPCATVTTEALSNADAVIGTFPEAGCEVRRHSVSGKASFVYSGGSDRFELHLDGRELKVDGEPLQAKAGYGKCGDETRYWALAEGDLPKRPEIHFKVDGRAGVREGLPIIGSDTLVFDGPGEVAHPDGTDRVTFAGLHYEIGEYLPKEGTIEIDTSSGHHVRATFKTTLWRLGEAEIQVDDKEPKTVPIIR